MLESESDYDGQEIGKARQLTRNDIRINDNKIRDSEPRVDC
jgi:hypothetical protein